MIKCSNKERLIVIIIIAASAILICGILAYQTCWPKPSLDKSLVPGNEFQGEVPYIINYGEGDIEEYRLDFSENSTVFSLLEELAERENFEIETTLYPEMGIFVKSIGGAEGGTDDKWWQYWINNNLGEVAADKKVLKAGDIVEWKFEAPEF
jgi:hypothetical protein